MSAISRNKVDSRIPAVIPLSPNRVWRTYLGGRILDHWEGKKRCADSHFPEDWIASTTKAENKGRERFAEEGLSSVVVDGKRLLLRDLISASPKEMVGHDHHSAFGNTTQFLLKLLDSSIRLHIQAHPSVDFSKAHLGCSSGKTEAYLILDVRNEIENPYIYLGFQHFIERNELKTTVEEQDISRLLGCFDRIAVKPGDVFIVPGGLPHAIGEGILMVEIMEPTDFVVRLEFERGGYVLPEEARFMGRDVDFALSMMDDTVLSPRQVKERYFLEPRIVNVHHDGSREISLINETRTPCFGLGKLEVVARMSKASEQFYVGIVAGGKGWVRSGQTELYVERGDKFFVPFKTDEVSYSSAGRMDVVLAHPPIAR